MLDWLHLPGCNRNLTPRQDETDSLTVPKAWQQCGGTATPAGSAIFLWPLERSQGGKLTDCQTGLPPIEPHHTRSTDAVLIVLSAGLAQAHDLRCKPPWPSTSASSTVT